MAMSDAAGSHSDSCCNSPDSSSKDDHRRLQPESAATLPGYSQLPINGVDTRAEHPSTLLGVASTSPPSRPPPRYEHPPPYTVDFTAGRGDASEVRIQRVPDSAVRVRREFLRARSPGSSSHLPYIIFACVVFWLCGCVFGAVAFILAVLARRKSATESQRLVRASLWVSMCGIIVGTTVLFLLLPFVLNSPYLECGTSYWNDTDVYWREPSTAPPEVTSPACHVIGNDTACFRFASSFTAELCSTVGGVAVNISSSSSLSLPPAVAETLSSVICYHNVCVGSYTIETSCFQHRTTHLGRHDCQEINGYYILEPSGRSCYYNDCPGYTARNGKCYRYRKFIPAADCERGFYEKGYCFYNSVP